MTLSVAVAVTADATASKAGSETATNQLTRQDRCLKRKVDKCWERTQWRR